MNTGRIFLFTFQAVNFYNSAPSENMGIRKCNWQLAPTLCFTSIPTWGQVWVPTWRKGHEAGNPTGETGKQVPTSPAFLSPSPQIKPMKPQDSPSQGLPSGLSSTRANATSHPHWQLNRAAESWGCQTAAGMSTHLGWRSWRAAVTAFQQLNSTQATAGPAQPSHTTFHPGELLGPHLLNHNMVFSVVQSTLTQWIDQFQCLAQ